MGGDPGRVPIDYIMEVSQVMNPSTAGYDYDYLPATLSKDNEATGWGSDTTSDGEGGEPLYAEITTVDTYECAVCLEQSAPSETPGSFACSKCPCDDENNKSS